MQTNLQEIRTRMTRTGWFGPDGCYTLFDGQFGSTGKGLLASVIAETMGGKIDTVTTNAGPNSGHTGYYNSEKILTQQIPVASIVMDRMGIKHACFLNGGAIIDPEILLRELRMYREVDGVNFHLSPAAARIEAEHHGDQNTAIASTGKGVGPAMQAKLGRTPDAVVGDLGWEWQKAGVDTGNTFVSEEHPWLDDNGVGYGRCFVETAQGWSLGINSGFYPFVTSRECSVAQALADLGVSPADHRKSIVSLRTYPIRVGNTPNGYSGDVYPDSKEVTFEELGQEPELTTVTQRVRRIFTWSDIQFEGMLRANKPDALFFNFMNYIADREDVDEGGWRDWVLARVATYEKVMGRSPDFVLLGWGPFNSDVELWDEVPF